MLSADDYIEMRKNAHSAKWLTFVIFLIALGGGFYVLVRASHAYGFPLIPMNGAYVILVFLFASIIKYCVKAYKKVPFAIGLASDDPVFHDGFCDGNDD
jgi:hypothetical protein